ncbi:hypothetical protein KDD93_01660 [Campylobacter sp. faydin G-24]|uniref:Molybdopterin-containing oxidoreductase III, DMSO/TMAO/BSO reductase family, monoheme c-type cytochrome n=1 Tax=Campylobacter anatolicus TaxID=2829105 RepID=A0ABS5HGQ1_9BACT|nr:hypothetical protein [Campylobacter anatolicus]MBR8463277.1 hypothetical protein [Campylobacter anatolicus]
MKMKFVALLSCVTLAFGGDFTSQTSPIMLNGEVVGKIEVLTPVEVVAKNGDKVSVKIKGVVSENYQAQIQKSIKDGEIYAVFDAESDKLFKKVKKIEDDYGEIWYESEGVYEMNANVITSDANALYKQAQEIYEQTCSACHRLHEPNSFTANQWPSNLQSMIDANYVALGVNELNLVTKYLQHNAKASE